MAKHAPTNLNAETAKPPPKPPRVPAPDTLSVKILQKPVPKLPHEADQSTRDQKSELRPEIVQAAHDLTARLQDTGRAPLADEVYRRQKSD